MTMIAMLVKNNTQIRFRQGVFRKEFRVFREGTVVQLVKMGENCPKAEHFRIVLKNYTENFVFRLVFFAEYVLYLKTVFLYSLFNATFGRYTQ